MHQVYGIVPVFPRPLVTMTFPPNRCGCTWAYSPEIYGTPGKPFVLKVIWGLCPEPGHHTKTSIGTSIWETIEKRKEENGKDYMPDM